MYNSSVPHTWNSMLPYKAAVINLWPMLFTTGLITYLNCEYCANWGGSESMSGIVCVRDMCTCQHSAAGDKRQLFISLTPTAQPPTVYTCA